MDTTRRPPLQPGTFRALPEPVRLEDTVTSSDSLVVAPEMDAEWRETQWLLRGAGI